MTRAASLSDFTGATVVRFEMADGCRINVDDAEASRRVSFTDMKLRMMPGSVTGDDVERYLYAISGLDRGRFVWDLPSSMRGTGAARTGAGGASSMGHREGFVFARGDNGRAAGSPVGKVIFMTYDRRFREGDPTSREDFEAMR